MHIEQSDIQHPADFTAPNIDSAARAVIAVVEFQTSSPEERGFRTWHDVCGEHSFVEMSLPDSLGFIAPNRHYCVYVLSPTIDLKDWETNMYLLCQWARKGDRN